MGDDAKATRVSITVDKDGKPAAQSYGIRVQNEGGRRIITVRGADAAGAMYGGLDIAEAIRMGTLDSLQSSDHQPHIAKRGIKFNIPLDLRTPSYTDCSDAAQANIPEMWERDFWTAFLDAMARHRDSGPRAAAAGRPCPGLAYPGLSALESGRRREVPM